VRYFKAPGGLYDTSAITEDVLLSGFGRFCVKKKAARKGRDPSTREDLPLDARAVVSFKCSWILRDKINELNR
jgi:integration host factor subunit alpha